MADEETPIDPELLDELVSDSGSDIVQDDEAALSSGLDDDSDDAYVESEHEEDDDSDGEEEHEADRGVDEHEAVDRTSQEVEQRDEVFNRLAAHVGETTEGETRMNPLDLEAEIARADADEMLARPMTKRQTRQQRRQMHKPSFEVQRLVGRGNMAYATGDITQTIAIFKEVIRHDPFVIAAWNTLGSVYEEQGNDEGARQMRFFAAHVEDEADTWKELAVEFRQRGQINQCVHCLRKALYKDPGDVGVLFELASIFRLQNNVPKAVDAFKKILKLHSPSTYDFTFLGQFHPILKSSSQPSLATTSFRTAFDWHISNSQPGDIHSSMNLEHVVTLVDDLMATDKLEAALVVLKRGQRWLQGRSAEIMWDNMDDDREYDRPGYERTGVEDHHGFPLETPLRHRIALIRLRLGDDNEALMHIDELLELDVMQYHTLFLELGRLLMKREMWRKALDCLGAIQEEPDIPQDLQMLYEISVCQHKLKLLEDAEKTLTWRKSHQVSLCVWWLTIVVDVDKENFEARLLMATVLDELGSKDQALEIVEDVIRERAQRERGPEPARPRMTKAERAGERKLAKRALAEQMQTTMERLWADVQAAEEGIAQGDAAALETFIQAAGTMVENFRLAKGLYTKNRGVVRLLRSSKRQGKNDLTSEALDMQNRLEQTMGLDEDGNDVPPESKYIVMRMTEFHGLDCEQWLNLIIKYCSVLMVKAEEDVALDILEHVMSSGLFANRRSEIAIRMTIIACAMRAKAYDKVVEHAYELSGLHQFRPEPLLIMQAALATGGTKGKSAWESKKLQRYLHRQLRLQDELIKGTKAHYSHHNERWTMHYRPGYSRIMGDEVDEADDLGEEDEEQDGNPDRLDDDVEGSEERESFNPRPTIKSPALNAIYGQIMLSTNAHQSALYYLLRAYELAPHDAYLCFLIAVSFFGRSMNRQSDNRNYQITQGMAFLTKYRKLSRKDEVTREEVEYNYARVFHGLGVPHLAIKHYEMVLSSVQRRMDEPDVDPQQIKLGSLACEAAHNLMLLYAAVGNTVRVREKSKWLAI